MSAHLDLLRRELNKRTGKNACYSLRAFAKTLGIHSRALSRVFSGKGQLTSRAGVKIARRLKLTPDQSRKFLSAIIESRRINEKVRVGQTLEHAELRPKARILSEDEYASVTTLAYFTLLSLSKTIGFNSDPADIAVKLGLSREVIDGMIRNAVKLGLLRQAQNGDLTSVDDHTSVLDPQTTTEIRRTLQREILNASMNSLDHDSYLDRVHISMTMAVNSSKLAYARERIVDFIHALADELEIDERDEVHQLAISLFPLANKS